MRLWVGRIAFAPEDSILKGPKDNNQGKLRHRRCHLSWAPAAGRRLRHLSQLGTVWQPVPTYWARNVNREALPRPQSQVRVTASAVPLRTWSITFCRETHPLTWTRPGGA